MAVMVTCVIVVLGILGTALLLCVPFVSLFCVMLWKGRWLANTDGAGRVEKAFRAWKA